MTEITAYYCWDASDETATYVALYQIIVMFILPFIFMTICYIFVIKELWISTKTIEQLTGNQHIPMTGMKKHAPLFSGRRSSPSTHANCGQPTFVTNCDVIDEHIDIDNIGDDAKEENILDADLIDKNENVHRGNKLLFGKKRKVKGQGSGVSRDSMTYSSSSLFTNG